MRFRLLVERRSKKGPGLVHGVETRIARGRYSPPRALSVFRPGSSSLPSRFYVARKPPSGADQARVHLWYPHKFGVAYAALQAPQKALTVFLTVAAHAFRRLCSPIFPRHPHVKEPLTYLVGIAIVKVFLTEGPRQ